MGLYTFLDTLDNSGVTVANIYDDMVTIGAPTHLLVGIAFWANSDSLYANSMDPVSSTWPRGERRMSLQNVINARPAVKML